MKSQEEYCLASPFPRFRRLALILLFLLSNLSTFANGPGNEIEGTIFCPATARTLEYATVSLFSLPDSVNIANEITGANGLFHFIDVPDGQYYIIIQYMGYEKKFIEGIAVNQSNRKTDLGRIGMKILLNDLDEVEIKDNRNALSFEIDRTVVDVSKVMAAQGGTAVDALQNVPSVQVDALGNVLLRGSADFTLLINGKPTLMEPLQVLQQTPAETIESIEVITNPSVKYEAKGTAGIINLKLKKQSKNKTEGLANLSLANGGKYSGSLSLNRQFKKLTTYAAISYSDKTQRTSNWGYRNVFRTDSVYHESIDSKRKINRRSADLKLGADYDLNDNNSLSFSAQLGNWKFSREISSFYLQTADLWSDTILSQYSEEDFLLDNNFLSGDLNFSHIFKNKEGHTLDIMAFYGGVLNNTSDDFVVEDPVYEQLFLNNSDRNQVRGSADYSLPLKHDITFSAGLFTDVQLSDYHYSSSDSTGSVTAGSPAAGLKTQFDYSNLVSAAYATVSGKIKNLFEYEAGLRLEMYHYSLQYRLQEINTSTTETNLFPSLHLSRELNDRHRFGLSYSRRVTRPDEWQLCPVVYSSDSYQTKTGNPFLSQSLIDSYEFSYLLMMKKLQLNTQIYYRYSHDPIGSYFLDIDSQFVETYANLDKEINSGIELLAVYKPVDWLQFRLTVDGYHSKWNGTLADGNELEGSSFQMNGSFAPTVTIKKNTTFQFLAIYYAPGKIPQGEADAFYYFDFILNHSFFNKKLILGLRTHNTFDTGLYHFTTTGNGYNAEDWYRYEGPVFIFTLSYKLNNFKQKQTDEGVRMDFDSGLDH